MLPYTGWPAFTALAAGKIRPEAPIGRIISGFWDQRTYHFWPPFFPSESENLAIFLHSWLGRKCLQSASLVGRILCTPILWAVYFWTRFWFGA